MDIDPSSQLLCIYNYYKCVRKYMIVKHVHKYQSIKHGDWVRDSHTRVPTCSTTQPAWHCSPETRPLPSQTEGGEIGIHGGGKRREKGEGGREEGKREYREEGERE